MNHAGFRAGHATTLPRQRYQAAAVAAATSAAAAAEKERKTKPPRKSLSKVYISLPHFCGIPKSQDYERG